MWKSIRDYEFEETHGAFLHMVVRGKDVKERMLESAKIQVRGEGWEGFEGIEISGEEL